MSVVRGVQLLGSTARIQRDIRLETVFAVVNFAVVALNVFYSLVLACNLIFLQL